jgi:predicted regulator of Ras-like GTPase activity (Roadblock/LC7/MglB family)
VDATQALADLTEISTQIRRAVLASADGEVLAAHGASGDELAVAARDLLSAAGETRPRGTLTQVEAATGAGSLFVVRDGERLIAATTGPEPTVGLVFYDLKSCLRAAAPDDEPEAKPKRRRRPKSEDGDAAG